MKITIITASRNSASTIRDTLESVASQTYRDVEHIVIDGGSTDGTQDIVRNWSRHPVRLLSESDSGIFDAMNKGIALAGGDVIGMLNSDDAFYDDLVLENVADVMRSDAVDACYADLVYVDKDNPGKVIRYWKSSPFQKGLFARSWMPPHPTFFTRKSIYEKYGNFDLNYPLGADVELLARLLERFEIKSVYIPKIFVRMRAGGTSNKSIFNIVKQNVYIYRACKNNNIPISFYIFFFSKMISRIRQYCMRPAG